MYAQYNVALYMHPIAIVGKGRNCPRLDCMLVLGATPTLLVLTGPLHLDEDITLAKTPADLRGSFQSFEGYSNYSP